LIVPPHPQFAVYQRDGTVDNAETVVKCASVRLSATANSNDDDGFAHVQPVIDKLPETLTVEQREKAIALIKRNVDVFGRHEFDVGRTNLLTPITHL